GGRSRRPAPAAPTRSTGPERCGPERPVVGQVLARNTGFGQPPAGQRIGFVLHCLGDLWYPAQRRNGDVGIEQIILITTGAGQVIDVGGTQRRAEYPGSGTVVILYRA